MAVADAYPFAIAAWNFDETSSTRADSVNTHDLSDETTTGSATGKFGNAADCSSDSLATASGFLDNLVGKSYSVSVWIYPRNLSSFKPVFDSSSNRLSIFITDVGANGYYRLNTGAEGGFAYSTSWTLNEWQLFVMTYNHVSQVAKVYRNDGIEVVSISSISAMTTSGAMIWKFGSNPSGGGSSWDGLYDDGVVLVDYVLSSSEVSEIWNGGSGKAFVNWPLPPTVTSRILWRKTLRPAPFCPGIGR